MRKMFAVFSLCVFSFFGNVMGSDSDEGIGTGTDQSSDSGNGGDELDRADSDMEHVSPNAEQVLSNIKGWILWLNNHAPEMFQDIQAYITELRVKSSEQMWVNYLKEHGDEWNRAKDSVIPTALGVVAEKLFKSAEVFQEEFDKLKVCLEDDFISIEKENEEIKVLYFQNGRTYRADLSGGPQRIEEATRVNFVNYAEERGCYHIALWFRVLGFRSDYGLRK